MLIERDPTDSLDAHRGRLHRLFHSAHGVFYKTVKSDLFAHEMAPDVYRESSNLHESHYALLETISYIVYTSVMLDRVSSALTYGDTRPER